MNKEAVALAHQILEGIPDENIELSAFISKRGSSLECGTLACGAGWLALCPHFPALTLFRGMFISNSFGDSARASITKAFDDDDAYRKLFASRWAGTFDGEIFDKHGKTISDKELLLHRLKTAYAQAD